MTNTDPIVITGLGTVSALGAGTTEALETLRRGTVQSSAVDRSGGFHAEGSARNAVLTGALRTADWIPAMESRRMSPPSRFAVVAARMALDAAGIERPEQADPRLGVAIATAFGPSSYTQKLIDQILVEGPQAASPAVFTECVANAPAGQVSIQCRAAGPNYTLSNREAGPLLAVIRGVEDLRADRVDAALVGSVEEVTPLLHAALDRCGALARDSARGEERARPFDRRRDGFVVSDGSTILVLEHASNAIRRGVRPLARVINWARAFDPSASAIGWGRGAERYAQAIRRGLERAGLRAQDIGLVVSGASGSVAGDRLEALTLRHVWEALPMPTVLAPKGLVGEYGGGFLAAAAWAAGGANIGGTAGFEEPDPDLLIVPFAGGSPVDARYVLVTGLAAGGAAAWIILERP